MSYDFLNTYTIPVYTGAPPPPPPPQALAAIDQLADPYQRTNLITIDQTTTVAGTRYATTASRFYAPGRPMPLAMPPRRALKRAADDASSTQPQTPPQPPPSKIATRPQSKEQAAIYADMVNGYPAALRRLVHAFHCELCDMKMNSLRSATDHYQSKTHDRHITQWLQQNYTDKQLPLPEVRRTLKKSTVAGGNSPTGPEAFHCELCDLKLTSLTHAQQHYSGRKHKLVASNVSKPSGAGYYNSDGKWVRTGTKLSGVGATADGRYGIGEAFKVEALATPDTTTPTPTPTPTGGREAVDNAAASDASDNLLCSVCNVSVTSTSQMAMHLEGGRHQKKLRQIALEGQQQSTQQTPPITDTTEASVVAPVVAAAPTTTAGAITSPPNSLLASLKEKGESSADLYRTPSGFYYCKACNISMSHESALQQHLLGKKHVKREAEERARTPNTKK